MDHIRLIVPLRRRQDSPDTGNPNLDKVLELLANPYKDQVGVFLQVKYCLKLTKRPARPNIHLGGHRSLH